MDPTEQAIDFHVNKIIELINQNSLEGKFECSYKNWRKYYKKY
jgi:hypothetical protein